ncbi:hypothetical protein [Nonomuraea dietziae]|uniref:hypothetical protein n=1 Tax=Nonomuraea dietziae TaxID=65515 RepID=UPI0031D90F85
MIVPSAAQMMEWIETVVAEGVRRPGYPADDRVAKWAAGLFADFGLREVRLPPVELEAWHPVGATLRAHLDTDPATIVEVAAFALPYTMEKARVTAPLARAPEPGAIVVKECALGRLPQALLREAATSFYDPEGVFDHLEQILPMDLDAMAVLGAAIEAGAAGFVGAFTGMPWESRDHYVPYDAVRRPVPAVWLSRDDSRRLLALMSEGPCTATLSVEAEVRPAVSHNVTGVLPGRSDQWAIIGSHHDAPWASAVEDASGVALVLAAARYWSQVPRERRPHKPAVPAHGGAHGPRGRHQGLHRRQQGPPRQGRAPAPPGARRPAVRDRRRRSGADRRSEPRWWFTTQDPRLEKLVHDTLVAEDLRRSFVVRPDIFDPMPLTDGAFFFPEKVPLVHFLAAPMYLFDSADTLDKVDQAALEPLTRAAIRIVLGTDGWTRPRDH